MFKKAISKLSEWGHVFENYYKDQWEETTPTPSKENSFANWCRSQGHVSPFLAAMALGSWAGKLNV